MGTVFCDKCGANLEETAKYCRICGEATPLSEATTKRFDEPPQQRVTTNPVYPSPTAPTYMPQFDVPMVQASGETGPNPHKRTIIILVSMVAFLVLALGGLLIFVNVIDHGPPVEPPGAASGPHAGPPPAPPPPPPVPGVAGSLEATLKYPNSQVTNSIISGSGKSVLQLTSTDSSEKVAKWYLAHLNSDKTVSAAGQTVIRAGNTMVIISGGEGGATITITRGGGE